MPVAATYPGVYIEKISSGVRTITGVATSIAVFINCFKREPMNVTIGTEGTGVARLAGTFPMATTPKVERALELVVPRRVVGKESLRDGRIVYSSAQNRPTL